MSEKQQELPHMPVDTKLAKIAKRLAGKKEDLAEFKLEIESAEKELLAEMKADKVNRFKITDGVRNYEINRTETKEGVRVKMITKQKRDHAHKPQD